MPTIDITYDERMVLLQAIMHMKTYEAKRPRDLQIYNKTIDEVATKISRTECQPGGCEYCTGKHELYYGVDDVD